MLTFFVIVPIVIGVFLYLFARSGGSKFVAITAQAVFFGACLYLFYLVQEVQYITLIGSYADDLGIALRADSLAAVFIALSAFIFLIVTLYSLNENNGRLFWLLLFIWQGALNGLFLTRDLFNIFVLTEVATLTVTVLILFYRDKRSMYDGLIYLMINLVAVQFFLIGFGYFYRIVGFVDMESAALAVRVLAADNPRALMLPMAFMLTFVALKCALVPLYNWLPKAHSTPGATPAVSAVLSGLHIKSGVYLLLRFQEIFGEIPSINMRGFFLAVGLTTAVFGVVMALCQRDIKRILAFSTIAQIGLIVAGLNLGGYNHTGSLFHSINHAIVKCALFLSAGLIAHTYGTRNIDEISGVAKTMPVIAAATAFAILGMVGMPLFNASISKYFLAYGAEGFLFVILNLINLGTIMIFIRFAKIFFGKPRTAVTVHADSLQAATLVILGVFALLLGLFGEFFIYLFFGEELWVDMFGYLQKSAIFAASTALGLALVKYVLNSAAGRTVSARIESFDLGFRGMCAMLGVFFAAFLVFV